MKQYRTKTNYGLFNSDMDKSIISFFEEWTNDTLNDSAKEGYVLESMTSAISPIDNQSFYAMITIVMSKEK